MTRIRRAVVVAPLPLVVGLAASVGLGGCSLLFVEGPPPVSERRASFACTTTPTAPVIDLAISMLFYLPVLGTLTNPTEAYSSQHTTRLAVATGGLVLGTVAAISAFTGLGRISECDQARAQAATEPTLRLERRPARPDVAPAPADGPAPAIDYEDVKRP